MYLSHGHIWCQSSKHVTESVHVGTKHVFFVACAFDGIQRFLTNPVCSGRMQIGKNIVIWWFAIQSIVIKKLFECVVSSFSLECQRNMGRTHSIGMIIAILNCSRHCWFHCKLLYLFWLCLHVKGCDVPWVDSWVNWFSCSGQSFCRILPALLIQLALIAPYTANDKGILAFIATHAPR